MAVSSATSWTDTTDIIANAGACRLNSVEVRVNQDASAASYIQLFDSANATPGSTAPNIVLYVPSPTTAGLTPSYHFDLGGVVMATGLTWFVSTTHDGATAATTHAPLLVDVHYSTGG